MQAVQLANGLNAVYSLDGNGVVSGAIQAGGSLNLFNPEDMGSLGNQPIHDLQAGRDSRATSSCSGSGPTARCSVHGGCHANSDSFRSWNDINQNASKILLAQNLTGQLQLFTANLDGTISTTAEPKVGPWEEAPAQNLGSPPRARRSPAWRPGWMTASWCCAVHDAAQRPNHRRRLRDPGIRRLRGR